MGEPERFPVENCAENRAYVFLVDAGRFFCGWTKGGAARTDTRVAWARLYESRGPGTMFQDDLAALGQAGHAVTVATVRLTRD